MGRSGTGLGMTVVWSAVEDHQGYVELTRALGRGTEITLYFPVTTRAPAPDIAPLSIEDLRGHRESILVVDDVDDQRRIARQLLERLGYTVEVRASWEEALDYLDQRRADVIDLDMIMDPGIDGLETYRRLLRRVPNQNVLIASGYSDSGQVKVALELGARYVKKPYSMETMGAAVREALDSPASAVLEGHGAAD